MQAVQYSGSPGHWLLMSRMLIASSSGMLAGECERVDEDARRERDGHPIPVRSEATNSDHDAVIAATQDQSSTTTTSATSNQTLKPSGLVQRPRSPGPNERVTTAQDVFEGSGAPIGYRGVPTGRQWSASGLQYGHGKCHCNALGQRPPNCQRNLDLASFPSHLCEQLRRKIGQPMRSGTRLEPKTSAGHRATLRASQQRTATAHRQHCIHATTKRRQQT